MIQVDKLTKYFGPVQAIDRVTFSVGKSEVVGFLGLNGAGKTTTMRILTTVMPATSGTARVAGFDVMNESMDVRRNIGFLPESVPLYPEMRVEEYIAYRAKLKGVSRRDRAARVEYCLERCRLKEARRRLLGTLSKGYRQRVGLADAMVHNPPIFILDEPTSGLDPQQIRETLRLIKELGTDHTVLLSTHILTEVEAICDRAIIIANGRVGLNQTLEEVESETKIVVEARGPADAIRAAIGGIGGVKFIEVKPVEEDVVRYEIGTTEDADLRERVNQTLNKHGWAVRRLERKRRSLQDAFFEVLRTHDPLAGKGLADPKEPGKEEAITTKPTH